MDWLLVCFLLDWLNFWAEVYLVQEETDLSQKTELLKIWDFWIDSLFPPGVAGLLGWSPSSPGGNWFFPKRICNHNFSHFCIFIVSFIPYWTEINIVLFFFFFFGGDMLDFLGFFFFWQGPTLGKKVGHFFLIHFFFFFTSTYITTRQTGGEGWWVVNSPCLSTITTHNLTLACLPHLFS